MTKKAMPVRLALFVLVGIFIFALTACQQTGGTTEPTTSTDSIDGENVYLFQNIDTSLPDFEVKLQSQNCGYTIQNNTTKILVEAAEHVKHIGMETPAQSVHLYIDNSDVLLLVEENGDLLTYQTHMEQNLALGNPLDEKLNELKRLKFTSKDETTIVADETVNVPKQEQISFTVYHIELTWQEQAYSFGYYVYEDGATLMSAEAPVEMHPLITKDTKWILDLEHTQMVNTETKETVPFTITQKSEGKGLSPDGSKETEDVHSSYSILMDSENYLQKIIVQYKNDTPVQYETIYNDTIDIPQIPDGAQQLPEQDAMQFIQTLLAVWSL